MSEFLEEDIYPFAKPKKCSSSSSKGAGLDMEPSAFIGKSKLSISLKVSIYSNLIMFFSKVLLQQVRTCQRTGQCSHCRSQQSVEGESRRVEQNGPQDEEGGPQSLAGEDLSDTQDDAVCHLEKRGKLCEEFMLQRKQRHVAGVTDGVLAFRTTLPFH